MAHLLAGNDDEEALLGLPPPPPPPPPSGKDTTFDSRYNKMPDLEESPKSMEDDGSYGSDDVEYADATMETPLAAHISHKTAPLDRVHRIVFKQNQNKSYGAISERSGDFCNDSGHGRSSSQGETTTDDDDYDDDDDDDDRSLSSRSSISSITTMVAENFREGLTIPFVDPYGNNICRGLSSLAVIGIFLGIVLPKDPNLHGQWYPWYHWISNIIGYTYFVLWSVCFYPQVLLNARRKSTKGLSNDFAILNFFGWLYYSAYQSAMFFGTEIQQLYAQRFANEKSTVHFNDVAFAIHAMSLSFFYMVQIVYYGDQKGCWSRFKLKPSTWFLVLGMGLPSLIVPVLITFQWIRYDRWLDYFYMLSWFKICCTVTKYSKQVWLNWNRKSTSGWNIWYNFLECSGGALSMVQICLDSWDMQDMSGITGNMAKFALGLATIGFDAIFYTQHYVLYPESSCYSKPGVPGMIIKTSSRLRLSTIETHQTEDTNRNNSIP